nr:hypothetical protein [Tanacetum cinerariifolium]
MYTMLDLGCSVLEHRHGQDQPLPADASPTALSPGYVVDFDPEENEEDPKEDPADYPANGGDNNDDESSDDDDDDDDVKKDEEEEEHLGPADLLSSLRYYKSECPIVKFQKRMDMIHGGLRASKPKTMQDAIEIATKLMNKKISTLVEPIEDQPLPVDASPTALSPGYVVDFDPKENKEDPKEDPADYPANGGDNNDDESSDDDDDNDDVEKDEEEEHLGPADLLSYLQMIMSPQAENTEAFETDESASTPSTIFTTTTRE